LLTLWDIPTYLLNWLLKTWGRNKILSEVEKNEIYKRISAKYHFIEKEKESEDFFKLCAIYQFEIPIHHDFVRNEKIKREYLNIWEYEGLIYRKIPKGGGVYYTVHDNSSFARLLLNTGDYLEILILDGCKYHLEEYIAEVLKRFLVKEQASNVSQTQRD
jgi:hypothetical protein